jgi:hypothetical protein
VVFHTSLALSIDWVTGKKSAWKNCKKRK